MWRIGDIHTTLRTTSENAAGLYAEILQRGDELGKFKKEGVQLQAASGGALEDNV